MNGKAVAPRPQGGCGNAAVAHKHKAHVDNHELPLPEERDSSDGGRRTICMHADREEIKDKRERKNGVKRLVDVFLRESRVGCGWWEGVQRRVVYGDSVAASQRWAVGSCPPRVQSKPRSSGHRWLRQQLLTGLIWESSTAKRIREKTGSWLGI
ncbi:hypothetical protein MRX96_055885 [Rhipicephalus microplus]